VANNLCESLIALGNDAIINNLLDSYAFRRYAFECLKRNIGLTKYLDFHGGGSVLRDIPDITLVLDQAQAELFEEAKCSTEVFVSTKDIIVVMSLEILPNFWVLMDQESWRPAHCDPDADDIPHLDYVVSFINRYSKRLQKVYLDPDNWIIPEINSAKSDGLWFDKDYDEEGFSF
jgi:hypothetical protein